MKICARNLSWVGVVAVASTIAAPAKAADAGAKTLIDYFLPTPILCPLTSNTWGAPGVVPRDVCNGLEDSTGQTWQYWDGKILQGADGKYRMFAGRWPQNKGFADWPNSVIVEALSNETAIGSYVPETASPFAGKEQNVTGATLNNGSFALLDSPGNVYTATALEGPWTSDGVIQITANGSTIQTATTENMTLWPSADGSFLVIGRTFQVMLSAKSLQGPYVVQTTIPSLQSEGYEDPVIWCSGGQYHLVANMYNARKAMHFTSADGIHNWVNQGLAYDPTTDFVRYTDGTVNHWYKAERPGVVMQNGHVSAFTFAVIDVDKTLDLANDTHGSKIIVVPFDGVTFDQENPGPGGPGCPTDSAEPVDSGTTDASKSDAGAALDATTAEDAAIEGIDAAHPVDAVRRHDPGGPRRWRRRDVQRHRGCRAHGRRDRPAAAGRRWLLLPVRIRGARQRPSGGRAARRDRDRGSSVATEPREPVVMETARTGIRTRRRPNRRERWSAGKAGSCLSGYRSSRPGRRGRRPQ